MKVDLLVEHCVTVYYDITGSKGVRYWQEAPQYYDVM